MASGKAPPTTRCLWNFPEKNRAGSLELFWEIKETEKEWKIAKSKLPFQKVALLIPTMQRSERNATTKHQNF